MRSPGEGTRILNLKPQSCAAASTRKIWNVVNTLWGFTFEKEKRRLRYPPPHHPHQPPFVLLNLEKERFHLFLHAHRFTHMGKYRETVSLFNNGYCTVLHLTSHVAVSHRNPSQANSNTALFLFNGYIKRHSTNIP